MRTAICLMTLALAFYPSVRSQAFDDPRANAGKHIAQKYCSNCHSIAGLGESPVPDAAPFRVIVAKENSYNLDQALGQGIMTGHPDIPRFELKPETVSALVAYLRSMAR